jgi:hypothetical protein
VRSALAIAAITLIPAPAQAYDCFPDPNAQPRRVNVERFAPALFIGWIFGRNRANYIGLDASFTHQSRGTFGGYVQAFVLHDPDAPRRTFQLGAGGIAAPWSGPLLGPCDEVAFVDPRPLGRIGYAWREASVDTNATSYAQLGVSVSAILGVVLSIGLPLQGGNSHGVQPNLAISLTAPLTVR